MISRFIHNQLVAFHILFFYVLFFFNLRDQKDTGLLAWSYMDSYPLNHKTLLCKMSHYKLLSIFCHICYATKYWFNSAWIGFVFTLLQWVRAEVCAWGVGGVLMSALQQWVIASILLNSSQMCWAVSQLYRETDISCGFHCHPMCEWKIVFFLQICIEELGGDRKTVCIEALSKLSTEVRIFAGLADW